MGRESTGAICAYQGQEALDVSEVIALEQRIAAEGTPLAVLMDRAGTALALAAEARCADDARIVIFAGTGNNGGDGWVAARLLGAASKKYQVTLITPRSADEISAQPAHDAACACMHAIEAGSCTAQILLSPTQAELAERLNEADLVIDALLGTGFAHDEVREPMGSWITAINQAKEQHGIIVIAADCPSGLNAQTAAAAQTTVHADATITMIVAKTGLVLEQAQPYVGELFIAPLKDQ